MNWMIISEPERYPFGFSYNDPVGTTHSGAIASSPLLAKIILKNSSYVKAILTIMRVIPLIKYRVLCNVDSFIINSTTIYIGTLKFLLRRIVQKKVGKTGFINRCSDFAKKIIC